ncbi:unnamed protein product [Euphydryas editha]|uniref:RING-CH-type domain-containing protein n=1 Tax=Euphydryas editha TaxID=104508 RepID=A0AAU9UDW9_EUPED|nr:unnamed protein product [Euphydryas editha]
MTSQNTVQFAQLTWREKAQFIMQIVQYWQWGLWNILSAIFIYSNPVKSIQDKSALMSVRDSTANVETDSLVGSVGSTRDCWICYDSSRPEPLIMPCRCTGDVAAVHHDCLRRWLVESATTPDGLKCKVCNTPYIVQETNRVEWQRGFTWGHWMRTVLSVACICGAAGAAWVLIQLFTTPVPRVLAAGGALLVCYVAVRFLGMNTVMAYQRAKVSSLKILTDPVDLMADQSQLSTISRTVTVEIASKAILDQALKGDVK